MVRKRGERWQANAIVDGKRVRPSFATKEEAERFEERAAEGLDPCQSATLGPFIDEQFEALWGGTKAEATHRINTRLIRNIIGDDTPLVDITEKRIDDFIIELQTQRKSKNSTVNRKLACLSKILARAARHKLIDGRPVIENLPEDGGRELTLSKEREIKARLYFEHMGMTMEGALFDFLLYTGCRIGEALKVPRSARNEEGVLFADRKNKKRKATNSIVPLVGPAIDAWETACSFSDADKPFGGNITYRTFMSHWDQLREHLSIPEEELPEFVPHMLRHTCCTRLVTGGASLPKVMKWMGHQSIRTTMRYSHLVPKDLDDLGAILEGV